MEKPASTPNREVITELAVEIVAAYVGNNSVPTTELSNLILTTFQALQGLGGEAPASTAEPLRPAVPIKKSITPEYILCLEDGKKLKMLKRYLRSNFGLTPDQYRARWGLPADYPMVAPNYAAQRSTFARQIGLGKGVGRSKTGRRGAGK